jgi:hypothetical protein
MTETLKVLEVFETFIYIGQIDSDPYFISEIKHAELYKSTDLLPYLFGALVDKKLINTSNNIVIYSYDKDKKNVLTQILSFHENKEMIKSIFKVCDHKFTAPENSFKLRMFYEKRNIRSYPHDNIKFDPVKWYYEVIAPNMYNSKTSFIKVLDCYLIKGKQLK